jgi:hypothetical protein
VTFFGASPGLLEISFGQGVPAEDDDEIDGHLDAATPDSGPRRG